MKSNVILGALAVVQALAVGAAWYATTPGDPTPARPLIDVDPDEVQRITISSDPLAAEPAVNLVRVGSEWRLFDEQGPLADSEGVGELLDLVLNAEGGDPVASTPTSHDQLKVSDDLYTRRVLLYTDEGTTTLTLGGGRTSYLRVDDDPSVYAAGDVSPFLVQNRPVDYVVQPYLDVDPDRVISVTLPTVQGPLNLSRATEGEGWVLEPPVEGFEANSERVDKIVDRLENLRTSILTDDYDAPVEGPRITWTTTDQGASVSGSLVLGLQADGRRRVRASDQDYAVEVGASGLKDLDALTIDELTTPVP